MHRLPAVAIVGAMCLLAACRLQGAAVSASASAPALPASSGDSPTPAGSASSSPTASGATAGIPLVDVVTIDWEGLRAAFLGEEPYPSGWEAEVDRLIADARERAEEIRVPDVTSMDPTAASCALWAPMVGHTGWATGAFLERQAFIAHVAGLAEAAPDDIREAAEQAFATASAAAVEQMRADGDRAIVSRQPFEAIETIGRWAVEHCDLPVTAAEPPDTEGWTDDEIAQACEWDRSWLEDAQEAYRAGPGHGRYAEHPHLLEVTISTYAYTQWHRAVVDNAADPPALRVETIPGGFCAETGR